MVSIHNHSTVVKDADLAAYADACHFQMIDFCRDWQLVPWSVRIGGNDDVQFVVVDEDHNVPNALAYHDLDNTTHRPIGVVLAKTVLDAHDTVSSALSHELLETRADAFCNLTAQDADGWSYWYEVCDAVQADSYTQHGTRVPVSNYVLRSYFLPHASGLGVDKLHALTRPFSVGHGGYQVRHRDGAETQITGSKPAYHGWRSLSR